jgi:hypothetical protein
MLGLGTYIIDKLTFSQLVKKLYVFLGTRNFHCRV